MRRHGLFWLLAILIFTGFIGILIGEKQLENSLEEKASSIIGTIVELDNLEVHLPRPGISFDSLRIIDPYEPKVNLVHTGRGAFFLDVPALLQNKFVVHDLAINDVRIGTARSQAAQIIEKRSTWPPWLREAERQLAKQVRQPPRLGTSPKDINLDDLLPLLQLPLLSKIERIQSKADSVHQKWRSRLFEIANAISKIKGLEQGTEKDLDFARTAIGQAEQAIYALKQEMEHDVENLSAAVSAIEIISVPNLDGEPLSAEPIRVSPQLVARMVFGKTCHQISMRLLRLLAVARRYMPPAGGAAPTSRLDKNPSYHGLDIQYVVDGSQPSFLIERIFVQSDSSVIPTRKVQRTEGKISGITSQPRLLGTPVTFSINPIFADPRSLSFSGTVDHTGEIPTARLEYDGAGFNQRDLLLPRRSYLPRRVVFKRGTTDGLMEVTGDSIQLFLSIYINPVAFDYQTPKPSSKLAQTKNRIDSKTRFSLFCEVTGTLDKPKIDIESSIDQNIADVIQPLVLQGIAEKKTEFQEKIIELSEAGKKEARQRVQSYERQTMSLLVKLRRAIDEVKESLRARGHTDRSHGNE